MGTSEKLIEVKDIRKSYNTKTGVIPVLDGVSLDVRENEFLVLLGPGQCGKTVLLNIIADLEQADSGSIAFSGGKPKHGDIGFVFQRYALFPWKTVMQNVSMNQKFKGVKRKTREADARTYIDLVGLNGFEKAYPAQLSGGMKQRVGIARAYASKSKLILMDEPFGALDAQTRYQMQNEVLRVWEHEKSTIVFVTNNLEEAITVGSRILLLSNKPSKVQKEYQIELPYPRDNMSREFLELRAEIAVNMDLAL